jgi:hypothetical protein
MQFCAVLRDPVNVPLQENIEDIFPPSDAPPNLEYGIAAVSGDPAMFIQEAVLRGG